MIRKVFELLLVPKLEFGNQIALQTLFVSQFKQSFCALH